MSGRSRRHKGWQTPFRQVIEIDGGPRFVTLHEARAFILGLPKNKQGGFWDPAIRCLLEAAETGDRVAINRAKLSIQLADPGPAHIRLKTKSPVEIGASKAAQRA